MKYKLLGHTGVWIPAIAQGAGDKFWDAPNLSDDEKARILRYGIDLGMTMIDTAEGSGNGRSEAIVGKAIKERDRSKVCIATKFSPEHSSPDELVKAVDRSLWRLETDHIDVYQSHWPNPNVPLEATYEALLKIKEIGKIKNIGVSNLCLRELIAVHQILGKNLSTYQAEYNLCERFVEVEGVLDFCNRNGITVLAYSPLDQGRLLFNPKQIKVLDTIAKRHNATHSQIILNMITSKSSVVALTRSTNPLHQLLNATSTDFTISPPEFFCVGVEFPYDITYINPKQIRMPSKGEWGRGCYQTVQEAVENRLGLFPSPLDLSNSVKTGNFLKPVRLVPSEEEGYYELIGGQLRYWSWVIAMGDNEPILSIVREDLQNV